MTDTDTDRSARTAHSDRTVSPTPPTAAAAAAGIPPVADERLRALRRMKLVAGGLLLIAAIVFIACRAFTDGHGVWGYVQAAAEASMVGGLADWFAVTALFRHPLGLPIPHTAIIPRNKDRIGDTLAQFLRDNFLVASVVARRMRGMDVAGAIGRFLQAPTGEGTRIRKGASRLIGDIFDFGGPAKGLDACWVAARDGDVGTVHDLGCLHPDLRVAGQQAGGIEHGTEWHGVV